VPKANRNLPSPDYVNTIYSAQYKEIDLVFRSFAYSNLYSLSGACIGAGFEVPVIFRPYFNSLFEFIVYAFPECYK